MNFVRLAGLNRFREIAKAPCAELVLPDFEVGADSCFRACIELLSLSCIRLINSLKVTKYL